MSPWRSWWTGVMAAVGSGLAVYWHDAPAALRAGAQALGPLLVIDGVTAIWLQSLARRSAGQPDAVPACASDTWQRATARLAMTLALVVLAAMTDQLLGTRHATVMWVVLWADAGHLHTALRRLQMMAKHWGFEVPIFPGGKAAAVSEMRSHDGDGHGEGDA